MKVLLVLALFSVCNANILWQEPPKSNLEVVEGAFWDYVAKVTQTAEDSLKQIRESDLGQEVNTKISESTDAVSQYMVALRTRVAPEDFVAQLTQEAELLKARLQEELSTVDMRPEELLAKLQAGMDRLKKEAEPYAQALDLEALKGVLQQKGQELSGLLEQSVNQLQNQAEMKQQLEDNLRQFLGKAAEQVQAMETRLSQTGQEVQQNLGAGAQDLQARLAALWENFSKSQ
ncbi:unnamed protein product [Ophioblennius macclurei]